MRCHLSFFFPVGSLSTQKHLSMTPVSVSCGYCCVQPARPLTKPLPYSFWEFSRMGKPTAWVSASISTMRLKQSASKAQQPSNIILSSHSLSSYAKHATTSFLFPAGFDSRLLQLAAHSVYAACIVRAWRLANAIPAMIIRRERAIFIKWGSVHHYSRA